MGILDRTQDMPEIITIFCENRTSSLILIRHFDMASIRYDAKEFSASTDVSSIRDFDNAKDPLSVFLEIRLWSRYSRHL